MTLDSKIKKLKLMGGTIAPKVADILEHLVKQSQQQACEGYISAEKYTQLKKDLKRLENDNRIYFAVIVSMWAAILIVLGMAVYYG